MNDIGRAVRVLKSGGVIAYPTETTYGLGCDPRNAKAIAKIFRIKGRDKNKSVLLVAASISQVKKVAILEGESLQLAKKYWAGALTIILPARRVAKLSSRVTKRGEVAIRVSSSTSVQALVRRFGFPIVSTSANRSGETPCRSGRAVRSAFSGNRFQPDFIVDAGALPRRKPSTIVRVTKDGKLEILRQGSVRL